MPSCGVRLSVCPAVCHVRVLRQKRKHILKTFSRSDSHTILVFRTKRHDNIPTGTPYCSKKSRFSTNIWLWHRYWTVECRQHFDGGVIYSTNRRYLLTAGDGRRSATHQWILFMARSLDVTPKKIEQNIMLRICKFEAEVPYLIIRARSRYCTVEDNYSEARSIARPLRDSRVFCWDITTGRTTYGRTTDGQTSTTNAYLALRGPAIVFAARPQHSQTASAALAVVQCPSVQCPSRLCIVSKRVNIFSSFFTIW